MTFKEFIKLAHCETGGNIPSSKRLWGAVMIASAQLCIIIASVLSFIKGDGINMTLKDLIEVDIMIGATLLGLQTVTTAIRPTSTSNTKQKVNPEPDTSIKTRQKT